MIINFVHIAGKDLMIKQNFLTNELAEQIAGEAVKFYLAPDVVKTLKQMMTNDIKEALKEDDKKLAHDILFNALFKSIAPFEKKFQAMLKRIWGEEERILIANIKKMKKAWLTKDKVDDILYPTSIFEKKLTSGASTIAIEVMEKEGPRVVELYDFDMIFDVQNPEVTKWLESYMPMFSEKLEEVNVKKLKATLIEGIEAGEGVPGLTNRVYETYKDWGFKRAEMIARTETLRASNAASKFTYLQSGVVEKIIWITFFDSRTCDFCAQMDGKIIDIKSNFFDLGDTFTIEVEGKKQSMDIDYTACEYPPIHPQCRCTCGPVIEE